MTTAEIEEIVQDIVQSVSDVVTYQEILFSEDEAAPIKAVVTVNSFKKFEPDGQNRPLVLCFKLDEQGVLKLCNFNKEEHEDAYVTPTREELLKHLFQELAGIEIIVYRKGRKAGHTERICT